MITPKQLKALKIVQEHSDIKGIRPMQFAVKYFDGPEHERLFTSLTNTGNGACFGKKAWRAAGCLLGKLQRQGLLSSSDGRYRLTYLGEKTIKNQTT